MLNKEQFGIMAFLEKGRSDEVLNMVNGDV
jgi:hypothetical protein